MTAAQFLIYGLFVIPAFLHFIGNKFITEYTPRFRKENKGFLPSLPVFTGDFYLFIYYFLIWIAVVTKRNMNLSYTVLFTFLLYYVYTKLYSLLVLAFEFLVEVTMSALGLKLNEGRASITQSWNAFMKRLHLVITFETDPETGEQKAVPTGRIGGLTISYYNQKSFSSYVLRILGTVLLYYAGVLNVLYLPIQFFEGKTTYGGSRHYK